MKFCVDGEICRTVIRFETETVGGRNDRIRDGRPAVKKVFQDGDASSRYSAVPGWIGRMGRRSLRDRLGKPETSVAKIAQIERRRIEDDVEVAQLCRVSGIQQAILQQVNNSAA